MELSFTPVSEATEVVIVLVEDPVEIPLDVVLVGPGLDPEFERVEDKEVFGPPVEIDDDVVEVTMGLAVEARPVQY